ncbi:hypothetical protein SAMN04487995_1489 [Dyadobacter koreensis]|uniref:Uncharacterized protein n=1 Tax=Dyadobacter koreensis TaxID=408657 RepID=A0A1H6S4V2_9BACT|nr:hypothetical protein [Dyadobacter koreensis]SEI58442.1 hypothetical protein SAMN04487995_1489 [Dyadobacter koreensis]
MNKVIEFLIKGIIALIWLGATVITSILLSPFLLVGWLSGVVLKQEQKKDNIQED